MEQQVEVVALDKDRVVVETAMRLDVAVAGLVGVFFVLFVLLLLLTI